MVALLFFLSILSAYAITIACTVFLLKARNAPVLLGWLMATGIMCCPLMIPSGQILARAIACLICIDPWFKITDLARALRRLQVKAVNFRQVLQFLVPFPALLVVYGQKRRRRSADNRIAVELLRIVVGGSLFVTGFWLLSVIAKLEALQASFALDHTIKLLMFVVTVESLSQSLFGIERLAGYETTPIIRFAFLSRTIGEFWCRYNTRVHSWMQHNVFLACGGIRSPVRGIFLTFFVSAVVHELAFGIATSRFDGTQFAFFMLQAPAVILSQRLNQTRFGIVTTIISHVMTITWFAFSSILFFHGVNRVFPQVYAARPWLPFPW